MRVSVCIVMREGVLTVNCSSMLAAVVDARGRVCLWMRVGVLINTCASMHAAVADARERVYYHLCQYACSGPGCVWACITTYPTNVKNFLTAVPTANKQANKQTD